MKTLSIYGPLSSSRQDMLRMLRSISSVCGKLRYEGGHLSRANARAASKNLAALRRTFRSHMSIQEKAVFPYAARHVPRLEAVLFYFRSEHREFRLRMASLESRLSGIASGRCGPDAGREAYLEALYLVSHMSLHIRNEENDLFLAIEREFHENEKKALLARMERSRVACGAV